MFPFDIIFLKDLVYPESEKETKVKSHQSGILLQAQRDARVKGHEIARLYRTAESFLPYIGSDISSVAKSIVELALNYGQIYAADRSPECLPPFQPWDFENQIATTSIKGYLQSIVYYGWKIALSRKLRVIDPTWVGEGKNYKDILKLFSKCPDKVDFVAIPSNRFNHFSHTNFKRTSGEISILLFRWLVAAIHNGWDKCSPELVNHKNPNEIIKKWGNQDLFNEITIKIISNRDGTIISVLNQCKKDEENTGSLDSGTRLVLLINTLDLFEIEGLDSNNIEKYLFFNKMTPDRTYEDCSTKPWKYGWEASLFLPNIFLSSQH